MAGTNGIFKHGLDCQMGKLQLDIDLCFLPLQSIVARFLSSREDKGGFIHVVIFTNKRKNLDLSRHFPEHCNTIPVAI